MTFRDPVAQRVPRVLQPRPGLEVHLTEAGTNASSERVTSGVRSTEHRKVLSKASASSALSAASISVPASSGSFWIIGRQQPDYPTISRHRGEEGELVVSVRIHPAGTVLETVLTYSSGFPRLDRAGLDYLKSIRFGFSEVFSEPVTKRVSLKFSLSGETVVVR
ncbi:MAG: hypothetical protein A2X94_16955 [Bdellovibrionales bacterium GWB1_55_8]|nr:MAG: hypothetical protein A2X94_16955 [Bdellovibrionales bacterium GWB1_55_8]